MIVLESRTNYRELIGCSYVSSRGWKWGNGCRKVDSDIHIGEECYTEKESGDYVCTECAKKMVAAGEAVFENDEA